MSNNASWMKDVVCNGRLQDQKIQIGSNIKRLRLERKLKATDLIREVNLKGVDINTFSLSKIEANTQHIKASQFKAIMEVLGCDVSQLLKEHK